MSEDSGAIRDVQVALRTVQHEIHSGLRQVAERLHALELSMTTRIGNVDAELRAEIASMRAEMDRRFAENALNSARVQSANYKLVITTALSIGAAAAAMVLEFGIKKLGG